MGRNPYPGIRARIRAIRSPAEPDGPRIVCPARGSPSRDEFETRVTICFLADEDLDADIIQGLRSAEPVIDILDVKTAGLRGMEDPALLERAAQQNRIVISHDRRTMTRFFLERLAAGKSNPGLFIAPQRHAIGEIVESLLLVWTASQAEEWRDRIVYLPFR